MIDYVGQHLSLAAYSVSISFKVLHRYCGLLSEYIKMWEDFKINSVLMKYKSHPFQTKTKCLQDLQF